MNKCTGCKKGANVNAPAEADCCAGCKTGTSGCQDKKEEPRALQSILLEVATNEDLAIVRDVPVKLGGDNPDAVESRDIVIGGSTALQAVDLDCSECAEDPNRPPGAPCSSSLLLSAIVQFVDEEGDATLAERGSSDAAPHRGARIALAASLDEKKTKKAKLLPSADSDEAEAVRAAAAIMNCTSESCVVNNPKFLEFAEDKLGLAKGKIAAEIERSFKTAGPRNSTELLNNFQIDATLQRWARVYPEFFPYPFAMMDFDRNGDAFGRLDIGDILDGKVPHSIGPGFAPVRRPAKCAGCVVNTDVSTGPGKHWVAVFVDCRPVRDAPELWTVEYFNSAGRPPPKPMIAWMERTKERLERYRGNSNVETVAVTSISHQQSQTECGVYSCFFLRARLDGVPYSFFQDPKNIISDVEMTKFRHYLFRAG
ncbi:MAG: hypothetical protein KGL39_09395 [Patescibacteria group bacterium]|nr:hypothetical protein [Patescibacteria group bacterium]